MVPRMSHGMAPAPSSRHPAELSPRGRRLLSYSPRRALSRNLSLHSICRQGFAATRSQTMDRPGVLMAVLDAPRTTEPWFGRRLFTRSPGPPAMTSTTFFLDDVPAIARMMPALSLLTPARSVTECLIMNCILQNMAVEMGVFAWIVNADGTFRHTAHLAETALLHPVHNRPVTDSLGSHDQKLGLTRFRTCPYLWAPFRTSWGIDHDRNRRPLLRLSPGLDR